MNLAGSNFLCREHPMMLFQPERCLAQGVLDEEENLRFISETGGNGPPAVRGLLLQSGSGEGTHFD